MFPYWILLASVLTAHGNIAALGGKMFTSETACKEFASASLYVATKDPRFAGTLQCLEIVDRDTLSLSGGHWQE